MDKERERLPWNPSWGNKMCKGIDTDGINPLIENVVYAKWMCQIT